MKRKGVIYFIAVRFTPTQMYNSVGMALRP